MTEIKEPFFAKGVPQGLVMKLQKISKESGSQKISKESGISMCLCVSVSVCVCVYQCVCA